MRLEVLCGAHVSAHASSLKLSVSYIVPGVEGPGSFSTNSFTLGDLKCCSFVFFDNVRCSSENACAMGILHPERIGKNKSRRTDAWQTHVYMSKAKIMISLWILLWFPKIPFGVSLRIYVCLPNTIRRDGWDRWEALIYNHLVIFYTNLGLYLTQICCKHQKRDTGIFRSHTVPEHITNRSTTILLVREVLTPSLFCGRMSKIIEVSLMWYNKICTVCHLQVVQRLLLDNQNSVQR